MGSSESLLDVADYCKLAGYGLTLAVQLATLARVLAGSRHKFVIKMLGMLITANVALISDQLVWLNMVKTFDYSNKKITIAYGFTSLGLLLFGVSHWMFAFKYYSMSRKIPYQLAKRDVPGRIVSCDRITNWFFLSLNIVIPLLYGISFSAYTNINVNTHQKMST